MVNSFDIFFKVYFLWKKKKPSSSENEVNRMFLSTKKIFKYKWTHIRQQPNVPNRLKTSLDENWYHSCTHTMQRVFVIYATPHTKDEKILFRCLWTQTLMPTTLLLELAGWLNTMDDFFFNGFAVHWLSKMKFCNLIFFQSFTLYPKTEKLSSDNQSHKKRKLSG